MSPPSSPPPPSSSPPPPSSSVGDLSAEFAQQKRPKSPPLAFEKTPNDSLGRGDLEEDDPDAVAVVAAPAMGRLSPLSSSRVHDLQLVVERQAAAAQLLHTAFAAERLAWSSERDWLHQRIANLEKLLKAGDGHSPAKSPVLSPLSPSTVTSPPSKSTTNRLPSIAEDEPLSTLAERRDNAPRAIAIPPPESTQQQSPPTVTFQDDTPTEIKIEEIPASPSADRALSPPPFHNRQEAGHTPLRAPRPLTPPPRNSMSVDGIEDTPTRDNTKINTVITKGSDEEEDKELSGPLNMPELPNKPSDTNFTFDALSKRLEHIERNPNDRVPSIFHQRSPGMASPVKEAAHASDSEKIPEEHPTAPAPTNIQESSASELSSNALSPAVLSPLSKNTSHEEQVHAHFEQGGIKLKAKTSMNFGLPFGQLGGFGGRRVSQDRE